MRRILLAGVGFAAMMASSSAFAADLPARMYTKAPAIVTPAWTWSGFYLGLNAGYGFAGNENVITTGQAAGNITNVASGFRPGSVNVGPDGFIGGGQIGYNWQVNRFVLGVEADIAYTDFRDNVSVITPAALGGPLVLTNNFSSQLDYLGTVRGRLGYAWDRTLVYFTGGLAYGEVRNSANFFGPTGVLQFSGGRSGTETGYTIGGGLEYAYSNNLSLKAEYLYYNLDDTTLNVAVIPGSGGGGTGYNTTFRNDGHVIRAGLNWKFNAFGGTY